MARPDLDVGTMGAVRTVKRTVTLKDGKASTRWRALAQYRQIDGVVIQIECTRPTQAAAKRALLQKARSLAGTRQTAKVRPDSPYAELGELYLQRVQRDRSGTTYDRYVSHMRRYLIPRLGKLRLQEINVPVLEDLMDALAEVPLAANTRRQIKATVSGSLQLAVRYGAIESNPVRNMSRIIGGARKRARALSAEERCSLLDKLDADQQAAAADLPDLMRCLAGTGVRLGEVIGLRWSDLNLTDELVVMSDPEAGEMRVPGRSAWINGNIVEISGRGLVRHGGKTFAANRVIGLPEWLVLLLQLRWKEDEYLPVDPVFPSATGGWRWPANTRRAIRGFRQRADVDWMSSHTFRRTVATLLDECGLTARQIADHLGHAQISMTQDVYMGRGAADPAAALALNRALGRRGDSPAGRD